MKRYKFLELKRSRIVSGHNNDFKWKVDEWYKAKGKLSMCANGFHCSVKPLDALSYVGGEVLAIVEVRGKSEKQSDKQCWSEMRIAKAYKWTKKDSVALSIYSAELVLKNFEKKYPDDNRPRKALEAAKKVLEKDTKKNRSAAWSAKSAAESAAESAAGSAWLAGSAAESATRSAESAAGSAWSAAQSAARSTAESAWSAWSAARSAQSTAESAESTAESAAWSAGRSARSAALNKINKWIINHIKELEEL